MLLDFSVLEGLGLKEYKSDLVWVSKSVVMPLVSLCEDVVLEPGKFKMQLRLKGLNKAGDTIYHYAEVHKDSIAAAKNNFPNWKIEYFVTSREYVTVALSNGEVMEHAEFNEKKEALAMVGITVDATKGVNGVISTPKFDPALSQEDMKRCTKLVAVAVPS